MTYRNRYTSEVISETCYLKLNAGARMKFDECYDEPTHTISKHNRDDDNDFSFTTALIVGEIASDLLSSNNDSSSNFDTGSNSGGDFGGFGGGDASGGGATGDF